jgi:hypothetical protein
MDLHGSLRDNLQAALKSVSRHRNRTIHKDTRDYWNCLLQHAQTHIGPENMDRDVSELTRKLCLELIERDRQMTIYPP